MTQTARTCCLVCKSQGWFLVTQPQLDCNKVFSSISHQRHHAFPSASRPRTNTLPASSSSSPTPSSAPGDFCCHPFPPRADTKPWEGGKDRTWDSRQ